MVRPPVTFRLYCVFFFFFNDPAPTEIYTLSLHDALPIPYSAPSARSCAWRTAISVTGRCRQAVSFRSEEHTSELQSHSDLVCRLLLEKKKKKKNKHPHTLNTHSLHSQPASSRYSVPTSHV